MMNTPFPQRKDDVYEILVVGRLEERWSHWFEDLTITHPTPEQTSLRGPLSDQSAVYGVLSRLRDLGLQLISVRKLEE